MELERKVFDALLLDHNDNQGIIECIFAVFGNVDHGADRILKGSFKKTIQERGDEVLVLDMHNTSSIFSALGVPVKLEEVGQEALPSKILTQYPDATGGVKATVQFLMDTPEGRGAYIRLKARAVQKWSFGYDVKDHDYTTEKVDGREMRIRNLKQIALFELSPVLFPMNEATVTVGAKDGSVTRKTYHKSVISYQDFPLTSRDTSWSGPDSELRVREWAGGKEGSSEGIDWAKYAQCFLWHSDDDDEAQSLSGYKLGYVDIIDGKPVVVPKAIFTIAAVLEGARGGVDVPEADEEKLQKHVERYYKKMASEFDDESIVAPWSKSASVFLSQLKDKPFAEAMTIILQSPELRALGDEFGEIRGEAKTEKGQHIRFIDLMMGKIHLLGANIADPLYIAGFMTQDERKAVGNAIGSALDALQENVPPEVQDRDVSSYGYGYYDYWMGEDVTPLAKTLTEIAGEVKAGRMLSQRNISALLAAFESLQAVLTAAGVIPAETTADDEIDEEEKTRANTTGVPEAGTSATKGTTSTAGPQDAPTALEYDGQPVDKSQLLQLLTLELAETQV